MGWFGKKKQDGFAAGRGGSRKRGPAWDGAAIDIQGLPAPEYAPTLAEQFVEHAKKVGGPVLDYDEVSLEWVDGYLDSLGPQGSQATSGIVFIAGCYVGEILVRNWDYRWVLATEQIQSMFGVPLCIVSPTGAYANPIGKAFNLVENGMEDSVSFHVLAEATSEMRRQANPQ